MIINYDAPLTYEEARRMGVYWDWNSIVLTNIEEMNRWISINLLEKNLSIEDVSQITGLSEEERKLQKARIWKQICAAVDDKDSSIPNVIKSIYIERYYEIIKKILAKQDTIKLSYEEISKIVGHNISKEQIEQLTNN